MSTSQWADLVDGVFKVVSRSSWNETGAFRLRLRVSEVVHKLRGCIFGLDLETAPEPPPAACRSHSTTMLDEGLERIAPTYAQGIRHAISIDCFADFLHDK